MLGGRDLRKAVPLPLRLDLQECHQRPHLLLDAVEADERVELGLELLHRPRRLGPPELI